MKKKNRIKDIFLLQGIICLYSTSGIAAKTASNYNVLSVGFASCYAYEIIVLAIYAFFWQIVIARIPLTTAFANKAVTTVWGLVWGLLFFHEQITPGKLFGVCLVIAGVVLFSTADREEAQ